MRLRPHLAFLIAASMLILLAGRTLPVGAQDPTMRAVPFYSPTCPHCHSIVTVPIVLS